jgi:thymidine kinase
MFTEPFIQESTLPNSGWIEVITGPMFSGKTEELMRRVRRAKFANQDIELIKPKVDSRYDKNHVVSHDESSMPSTVVESSFEILEKAIHAEVVAIDEIQFFDDDILNVSKALADKGKRVIVAGLDKDYLGMPFGPIPQLMATAEFVTKLHAICVQCGSLASFSFRVKNSDKKIMLGAKNEYEARCRSCFNKESE